MEKPVPIAPLIALDRERCILCYRCTRFSESVAEDGQLVAVNRGALSMIATFADEPSRAPFSGNVTELCPVGALTSTQYRFEARPWEIQDVPTVCGLCPVGCNVSATIREGKVKRILSRNHPEVDQGWLCDKGRFAFSHLYAADRVRDPLRRLGRRRFEELPWDTALDEVERSAEHVVVVWSGGSAVGAAALGERLGAAGVFYLPATPNGRAVADAWHAAGEGEPARLDSIGLLLVSGDEAAADPRIRELGERADAVVAIVMFADPVREWVDLVLPGTSYLERDGTMV